MPNTREKLIELISMVVVPYFANEIADLLIANGVRFEEKQATSDESKWIPVTERLPNHVECVLIWCGSYIEMGWYDAEDKTWRSDLVNDYEGDVTHWMPLPEPPKGDNNA